MEQWWWFKLDLHADKTATRVFNQRTASATRPAATVPGRRARHPGTLPPSSSSSSHSSHTTHATHEPIGHVSTHAAASSPPPPCTIGLSSSSTSSTTSATTRQCNTHAVLGWLFFFTAADLLKRVQRVARDASSPSSHAAPSTSGVTCGGTGRCSRRRRRLEPLQRPALGLVCLFVVGLLVLISILIHRSFFFSFHDLIILNLTTPRMRKKLHL